MRGRERGSGEGERKREAAGEKLNISYGNGETLK